MVCLTLIDMWPKRGKFPKTGLGDDGSQHRRKLEPPSPRAATTMETLVMLLASGAFCGWQEYMSHGEGGMPACSNISWSVNGAIVSPKEFNALRNR